MARLFSRRIRATLSAKLSALSACAAFMQLTNSMWTLLVALLQHLRQYEVQKVQATRIYVAQGQGSATAAAS